MSFHSRFELVHEECTIAHVTIRDLSGHISIEQDAAAVVLKLHQAGLLTCSPPLKATACGLFFYDPHGHLREIRHDGHGQFLNIVPMPRPARL